MNKKQKKRTWKVKVPTPPVTLVMWFQQHNSAEKQICSVCQKETALAEARWYEPAMIGSAEALEQAAASQGISIKDLMHNLFERTYQEQKTKGPQCYTITFYCSFCLGGFLRHLKLRPQQVATYLENLEGHSEETSLAYYCRITNLLTPIVKISTSTTLEEVWEQRVIAEQFRGTPGEVYHLPDLWTKKKPQK